MSKDNSVADKKLLDSKDKQIEINNKNKEIEKLKKAVQSRGKIHLKVNQKIQSQFSMKRNMRLNALMRR